MEWNEEEVLTDIYIYSSLCMSTYVVKSLIFFCTNHGAMGFGNDIEWPIHLGEEAPGAAFGSHLGT